MLRICLVLYRMPRWECTTCGDSGPRGSEGESGPLEKHIPGEKWWRTGEMLSSLSGIDTLEARVR